MAISISIGITQNSQNIANNTSNVTVKVTASWTYGSYNKNSKSGWLKIDGTTYDFTSSFNTGQSTSGSQTLFTKTVNITHASDGKKTLSCSASYTSGVSSGTVTASASKTLTTIPRASSLTAGNGTLGVEQTITINVAATGFKHRVTYKCGSVQAYIAGSSSTFTTATSVKWTPPISLASQNTTGTSLSATLYVYTYTSEGTRIGTTTKTITLSIPSSVVPSISKITLSEASSTVPSGYGYVKGHSKLKVVTTSAGIYGSTIKTVSVKFDSVTYSGSSITTNTLRYSGTRTVTVTVTDSRGRKATGTASANVQDYSEPVINSFTVVRCKADGSLDEQGEYMLISYNASITALGNKNAKNFTVRYKKSSETNYTEKIISATAYSVGGSLDPIPADSGSSYNVSFDVSDTFATVTKNLMLSTAFTILNFKADGTGIGVGKVSEESDLFDVDFKVRFNNGVVQPILEEGTNLNDLVTPNTYTLKNAVSADYINCPILSGTGTLKTETCGEEGQLHQIVTVASKTNPLTFERFYYQGAWGEWVNTSNFSGSLLWSGALYMIDTQTITLSQKISEQPNGIVLVFSEYEGGEEKNYMFQHKFIPKYTVSAHSGVGHCIMLCNNTLNVLAAKYLYIADDTIKGHANNNATGTATSGVVYTNNRFVLRYVIGV